MRFFIAAGILFQVLCAAGYAQTVSSVELINASRGYDGERVSYEGEVIGDVMPRAGGHAWINVNDGHAAIGVWVPKGLAQTISSTGDYTHRGDRIIVSGIFRRSCLTHGGDLDIHAETLRVAAFGGPVQEKFSVDKRTIAIILSGALCLTILLRGLRLRLTRK